MYYSLKYLHGACTILAGVPAERSFPTDVQYAPRDIFYELFAYTQWVVRLFEFNVAGKAHWTAVRSHTPFLSI